MAKRKSTGERVPRPEAEAKPNPESEKELGEPEAIAERQKLLDELTPAPDREEPPMAYKIPLTEAGMAMYEQRDQDLERAVVVRVASSEVLLNDFVASPEM
jgi:hypothetical protein